MRLNVVKLIPDKPKQEQCVATRVTRYANDTRHTSRQCKHLASFVVEGKHYCKRHAESEVMTLALRGAKP